MAEASNPTLLSDKNWEELERLDRKRMAIWYQTTTPAEKRRRRRQRKWDAATLKRYLASPVTKQEIEEFSKVLEQFKI